jgi:translation initiation factor IF-3
VRLIDQNGQNRGIVRLAAAQDIAAQANLDLVEVAADARPPVCRIMDYGKYRYEQEQKAKQARKHQSTITIKEIKFRPKIDPHDYATKKGHVTRFLEASNKVKVTIMFRGREMAHTDLGRKILDRLVGDLGDLAIVESMPKQEGRNMIMVVGPNKRYLEDQAKQRAREERELAKQAATAAPAVEQAAAAEPVEAAAPAVEEG